MPPNKKRLDCTPKFFDTKFKAATFAATENQSSVIVELVASCGVTPVETEMFGVTVPL